MESWINQLLPIITEYKDGNDFPLSHNDVDEIVKIIKAKINLHEGNITDKEYNLLLENDAAFDRAVEYAGHYLCDSDVASALQLIINQSEIDSSIPLDDVDGITVWGAVSDKYTVDEFLEMVYR